MAMRVLFRSTASRAGRSRSAAAHAVLPSSRQCQWGLASSASSSSPLAQTLPSPRFFSSTSSSPSTLDEETEKKAGWMLKLLAAGTFTYVGLNVFPLMGDSLVKHSVALLRTKDPLFRRSGASRLTLIATDDERRLKIVDAGGIGALVNMLESASDDDTRREAVKALATLSECDAAVEALHKTGVQPFVNTLSTSSPDLETQQHTSFLIERLEQWRTKTSC